jgi:hypothetical protein
MVSSQRKWAVVREFHADPWDSSNSRAKRRTCTYEYFVVSWGKSGPVLLWNDAHWSAVRYGRDTSTP